jgi:peptide chain release factor 1
VAQYAQERAELEEIVNTYRSYKTGEEELAGARAILDEEEDAELRQMALDEVNGLRVRLSDLEAQLRLLLLPRDPRDQRDVIVEIRAGTGGDEAGFLR